MQSHPRRIVILSGAYDDQYLRTRSDNPVVCVSAGKRVMLYRAIAEATGSEVLLLSPQPRGRKNHASLPALESRFDSFPQWFCKASGIRKVRFLVNMLHYIRHVHRHSRSGDVFVVDNYELIYVLAICHCRLLGRRNPVILEYEDGKHAIDRGIFRLISGLAETLGRPLVQGTILATPTLGERLPDHLPMVAVPGILRAPLTFNPLPSPDDPVCFLYSGSLDHERGVPLLIEYLEKGELPPNAVFHITGQGHFVDRLLAMQQRHPGVVHFHGTVSQDELARIRSLCHFGFNLQSSASPVSSVTYPSKTFDYLNAGIRVISTRTAGIERILGSSAIYLDDECCESLAKAVQEATTADAQLSAPVAIEEELAKYTFHGTCERLKPLFSRF